MTKRSAEEDNPDGYQAYLKRQRISDVSQIPSPIKTLGSAQQLQQALVFDQDAVRAKRGE